MDVIVNCTDFMCDHATCYAVTAFESTSATSGQPRLSLSEKYEL